MEIECKCKGCTKRKAGCHAKCKDYADYKKRLTEAKKQNPDIEWMSYLMPKIERRLKKERNK